MSFQPNDNLLAFKHIGLSEQLNGTEKQFAAFLIDSYNRKTGRCDPSEETAAFLLSKSQRSIIRAGNCHSACNIDPPYCRICECYPDGAIADDDAMSIDWPRQMAFPACSTRGAVGGSGPT
jgi:hypothetical protein